MATNQTSTWVLFALLSAFFAALTTIFGKIGVTGVDSNLGTAIRTVVILAIAWGIAFGTGATRQLPAIAGKSWLFLILSGVATGLSWLCYYRALQLGPASSVAPVDKLSLVFVVILAALFLNEPITPKTLLGTALIVGGTLVFIL
jgi:transporter family protein